MNRFVKLAAIALAAWSSIAAAPDDPASFAVRVAVVVAPGSPVQRLLIPAGIVAAAQTPDLSDLRVFDATGKAMPMARIAPAAAPLRRDALAVLPILGAADALTVTGVSLRLDGRGEARIAQVVGTVPAGPASATLLGVLLDAREIAGAARSLIVDADVPDAQPVTFAVAASSDLQEWRPLGERVIYRATEAGGGPAATSIRLDDAAVRGDYLRVTWRSASRLLSPVTIRRAVLVTRPDAAAPGTSIDAVLPAPTDAHAIDFALPFAARVATIRVVTTGGDMIVPVRILGRDDAEQPWTVLGEGTATRGGPASAAIALGGARFRTMRIEADRRSAGFTSTPAIGLGFARRDIVFLASGCPPFVLAAGGAGVADAFLPLASLMTQVADGRLATATTAPVAGAVRLLPASDSRGSRQALLWLMLLGATALLAALAFMLWKRGADAA